MGPGPGGSVGSGVKADPNLVPLLDLVLQILMFFIITVNFVARQVNENIKLPFAQMAKPMDKGETDVLFLNVNGKGQLEVVGRDQPLTDISQIKVYLRNEYKDREHLVGPGKVKTAVILRVDRDAEYKLVYQIMRQCKEQGFRKLKLRAMQKTS
jgi:biopolymer transport protein ExbD